MKNAIYEVALRGINLNELYEMPSNEFAGLYTQYIELIYGKPKVTHLNERQKDMIKQAKGEGKND